MERCEVLSRRRSSSLIVRRAVDGSRRALPDSRATVPVTKMNEWEWQLLEEKTALDRVCIAGPFGDMEVKQGDRIRLKPRAGGDVFDLALAGKIAVIETIEQ